MSGNPGGTRGHATFDHTADVGLEAWGATFGEALAEAGMGLQGIMLHGGRVRPRETRIFHVTAQDAAALLVAWLSELLYAFDTDGWLSASLEIAVDDACRLTATAYGETFDDERHELGVGVKAASYHDLAVRCEADAVRVRVILDV